MAASLQSPSTKSKTEWVLRSSKDSLRSQSALRRTKWEKIPRELRGEDARKVGELKWI